LKNKVQPAAKTGLEDFWNGNSKLLNLSEQIMFDRTPMGSYFQPPEGQNANPA